MAGTVYFWQGGRKIEVRRDDSQVTIHAENEAEARVAAARAGLELRAAATAAPGLVQVDIVGDRDSAMERLRGQQNVVHHVYRQEDAPENEVLITDTFFLKFKEGTPEHRVSEYLTAERLEVVQEMGSLTFLVRVTNETGRNPIRASNAAASREDVEYAEPNLVRRLTRFFIPADTLFFKQWHLHAPAAGNDLELGAGIFAPEAWDITIGRRDVVVAVADDGFDLTHPDFQGQGKVVASLNATLGNGPGGTIQWDADVSPRPGDYHGTPCLGVAVAEGNGTGVVGVAPGCSLVAVRFPLSMTDAHFVTMFRKISSQADVVSCSWGVGPADAPMSTLLRTEMATLARTGGRRGKGLIFCIAAGNNNCPVQDLANTRTYQFWTQFGIRSYSGPIDRWVAAHPDAIVVSGCTSLKTRSAYSSWGRNICVCAPTDNWDDLRQITPPGRGVTTTDNEGFGQGSDFTPGSRFTDFFGGTSSATPTVAGLCGLVLSANSSLTALEVKDLIQRTADKELSLVTHTPVNEVGDFDGDGFSLWFGHGKVNAFRAVDEARSGEAAERTVDESANPALAIPDAGVPVESAIEIDDDGTITELRVQVNISHTYIGDLRVDLIGPAGTGVVLHNNSGRWEDDLVRTYSSQESAALRTLLGSPIRGTWRLRVVDTFRLDVGTLNSWRLVARVRGGAAPAGPAPAGRVPAGRATSGEQKGQQGGKSASRKR